jgi:hypothetical protein
MRLETSPVRRLVLAIAVLFLALPASAEPRVFQ